MEKNVLKLFGIFALMLTLLAGCGEKDRESESKYNEVLTESEQLPDVREDMDASEREGYIYLGSQLRNGERLQIWGTETEEGGQVYLHRENGERELLMEDVHHYFFEGFKWWVDDENSCFLLSARRIIRPKMDEGLQLAGDISAYEGVVFQCEIEGDGNIIGICQLGGGRFIVLRGDYTRYTFSELDPDSGGLEDIQSFPGEDIGYSIDLVSAEGNQLLVLGENGAWEVNLIDGRAAHRVSFEGTTFKLAVDADDRKKEDFRVLEDGRIELLWSDGTVEFLNLTEIGTDKEIIVFRLHFMDKWLEKRVVEFNQRSKKYRIVIEEKGDSVDLKNFREQTDLEIGAGKGGDIIMDTAANDVCSLMERGAFADLTPFMDASGFHEEDFFPAAFFDFKDDSGIYGVRVVAMPDQFWLKQEVVGERSISNIEEMVDCLLAYEEEAVLWGKPSLLLKLFMRDSESLCGTVDFENGTCDFSGELFEKLLEAAKRYGYDERKKLEYIGGSIEYHSFYNFCDDEYLAENGLIPVGYMADDGGHLGLMSYALSINANSDKKEGAWEFLSFLMGEEAQLEFYVKPEDCIWSIYNYFPMNKNAFEELCQKHEAVVNGGVDYDSWDNYEKLHVRGLTEERAALLREALEDARPHLIHTAPLIEIIIEEAETYFSGDRSIDEVRKMIENRVQLYLNERK